MIDGFQSLLHSSVLRPWAGRASQRQAAAPAGSQRWQLLPGGRKRGLSLWGRDVGTTFYHGTKGKKDPGHRLHMSFMARQCSCQAQRLFL